MKKAQFWYGDFLVAVLILMIIGMLFVTSIRDITSRNEIIKDLILEASDISSTIMTEGYDTDNWRTNLGTIGFLTDNKFNITKFEKFLELSDENQRLMLGTSNHVWIYLQDRDGDIIEHNLDYKSIDEISAKNLVHIKRFVFYDDNENGKGDIYVLGVVVWQ